MTKHKKHPERVTERAFPSSNSRTCSRPRDAAIKWFEDVLWAGERCCGHCGSVRTCKAAHAKMPYWCSDCRSYFSVRHGHGDAILENPAAEVGDRHLPLPDQPQERVEHEAPPRSQCHAENRLVYVAPYPRGMVGTTPGWVRWPRGGRRDVCGRQGEEHARHEAEATHRTRGR